MKLQTKSMTLSMNIIHTSIVERGIHKASIIFTEEMNAFISLDMEFRICDIHLTTYCLKYLASNDCHGISKAHKMPYKC